MSLDRIRRTFAACRGEDRPALLTYVMGGDPSPKGSRALAAACLEAGADVLEIGIPFSDPIADGPTIQRAAERALASGTTLRDCFDVTKAIRKRSEAPVALMGYVNPVLAYGADRFFKTCGQAGVDAVILPDLPPEEAGPLCAAAGENGVGIVFLLAPTSTEKRWEAAFRHATAFIYFVSITGVTGARSQLPEELASQLDKVRQQSPVPVVVGFGISRPEQARALRGHADGIVVGSAIVAQIGKPGTPAQRAARVRAVVAPLRKALGPVGARLSRVGR
jgi:tryptophan synthase alpha chain